MDRVRAWIGNLCQGCVGSLFVWQVELYRKIVARFLSLLISSLALLEMRIAIAKLIWHYDISLVEGQDVPKFSHLSVSVTPLKVRVRRADGCENLELE